MVRTTLNCCLAFLLLAISAPLPTAGQDPAAERLFADARRILRSGDSQAALESFQLLVQQFPKDRLAPKALLRVAEIHRSRGDLPKTRTALDRLRSEYGRSLESAAAFVMQAEIQTEQARRTSDLEDARDTFRRVPLLYGRESYPDLDDRVRARIRTGELSLQLGDYESAVGEFLTAIEDEPPGRWTGEARLLLARALSRRGDWLAAAEVLQRLASENGSAAGTRTSTADERASAVRLLSLIHRRVVRARSGLAPWLTTARYPASGLQLKEPGAVAASEDGRLVIVDPRLKQAILIDIDGAVAGRATVNDANRAGWSAGFPFVVTETNIVVPFGGHASPRFLEPIPGKEKYLKDLLAAERGPFGDWFVVAKGWRSLLSFESPRQGQELLATAKPDLVDVAQDQLGRLYALDAKAKKVLRLGLDRRQASTVLQGSWKRPVALDLDPFGNLYVLDRGNRTIEMYDVSGTRQAKIGPTLGGGVELRNPVDLAVDGSGRLFIADSKLPFVVLLD
ncbi:MAG: tetratricopeptide repeat protein [bacterium]|nr:tetratricopeptide repeat protein [bacterium]